MENLAQKIEAKLKARETKIGNSWRPEEGEVIEGIVEKIGNMLTDYGDKSYIEIAAGLGKYTVWLNPILQEQIEEEEVSKGDHIAIKYLGLKKTKSGDKAYKDYILVK